MSFSPFDEYAGYPIFNLQPGFQTATRSGIINWEDIDEFANYLFPLGLNPTAFPGKPWLLARALRITPLSKTKEKVSGQSGNDNYTDLTTYTSAEVTIQYETARVDYSQGSDPTLLLTHRK